MDYRLVVARSEEADGIRRKMGVFIKDSLDPHAHGNDTNVLYLHCISISILVVILYYSFVRFGESNGTPLQYSCLKNLMDGGAWWAAVHGVATSRTRLSDFTFTFHFHILEKEMATHSSVLAWRIPETEGCLVGCRLWGHTESDMTEAT